MIAPLNVTPRIIRNIRELQSIRSALSSFLERRATLGFCVDLLWIDTWLHEYLAPPDSLIAVVLFSNDEIIAFFPLYKKKRGCLGYRVMFIGTGEPEESEVCSEYMDFVVEAPYIGISFHFLRHLMKAEADVTGFEFLKILKDSLCKRWLDSLNADEWTCRVHAQSRSFRIDVQDTEMNQVSKFPQSTARRRGRRFLERTDIIVEKCISGDEFDIYFTQLVQLHQDRWHGKGKAGVFSNETFTNFHRRFARQAIIQGKCLLFRIKVKGVIHAVFYGMFNRDTLFYYQSGILTNGSLGSSGIAMHLVALRYGRERGVSTYDLMSSSSTSYKNSISDTCKSVLDVLAFKRGNILRLSRSRCVRD